MLNREILKNEIKRMVITFYFVKQLNKEDGDVSQL